MGNLFVVIIIIAAPVLFFMLTWVVVTVYRILFPEEPLDLVEDPVQIRQKAAASGTFVPVGLREIREDQRHHRMAHIGVYTYEYHDGMSAGLPLDWIEDLDQRRN